MNIRHLIAIALTAVWLTSCGENSNTSVIAPENIKESFNVDLFGSEPLALDGYSIAIQKNALEKEFLLQGSLITQWISPQFSGLKSRVVAFRKIGSSLYMLEATQGHTVTNDLPQRLILAEFPILRETLDRYVFDFNKGMSKVFAAADWRGQDFEGSEYQPDYSAIPIQSAYIEKAELNAQNQLMIRQIAQVTGSYQVTIEARYYLSPYRCDGFEPFLSPGFDRVGYFEVAPQLETGGNTQIFATKFNINKPVVFAISANTPLEYRPAIRDAILYWNKAFGKEILQVVDAPAGITAPDINYNIIQWINWDQAGFAYADAQMDPRTGQILHAQVYMTSAFAFGGKSKAKKLLQGITSPLSENALPSKQIALKGLSRPAMCNRDTTRQLKETLASIVTSNLTDSAILKISQDYIRETVAHEVGHTLGLRHNFAGSITTSFPLEKRSEIVWDYFESGKTPDGVIPSSSVMDYQRFEEASITGDIIAHRPSTLLYDEKAIGILYLRKQYTRDEIPPFCTDSHLYEATYLDCRQFDTGSSPIEFTSWDIQERFKQLPVILLDSYANSKNPKLGGKGVEAVTISPKAVADYLHQEALNRLIAYTTTSKFIKIRKTYAAVGQVNEEEVRKTELDFLESETNRLGGIHKVFEMFTPEEISSISTSFNALLQKKESQEWLDRTGQITRFNDSEIRAMKIGVEKLTQKLPIAIAQADIEGLGAPKPSTGGWVIIIFGGGPKSFSLGKIVEHPIGDALISIMRGRIDSYVFATRPGEEINTEVEIDSSLSSKSSDSSNKKTAVRLPKFVFPVEVREGAAGLLRAAKASTPNWGYSEKIKTKERFKQLLASALGDQAIELFSAEKQSTDAAKWLSENSRVLYAF